MMRRLSLAALLLLGAGLPAFADVVVLRNGRKLEGQVVKKTRQRIELRLSWGVMKIPRARIKAIKKQMSAKKEYSHRAKTTDMDDPVAVERLAQWAAKRGLGKEARDLGAMALGMRLDRRLVAAKKRGTVAAWVETYHWARSHGVDHETQLDMLQKARAIAPSGDRRVEVALAHFRSDIAAEERRLRRMQEAANRPHYAEPENQSYVRSSKGLVPVSGKVTFRAILKPEEHRKQVLARLAAYRRAAAAAKGSPKRARRRRTADPRDQVQDAKKRAAKAKPAEPAAKR